MVSRRRNFLELNLGRGRRSFKLFCITGKTTFDGYAKLGVLTQYFGLKNFSTTYDFL
jgi:hypothetical protein